MKSQRTYEIRSRAAVLIAIKMAAEEVGIDIPKGHHDVVCRDAAHFQKKRLVTQFVTQARSGVWRRQLSH